MKLRFNVEQLELMKIILEKIMETQLDYKEDRGLLIKIKKCYANFSIMSKPGKYSIEVYLR